MKQALSSSSNGLEKRPKLRFPGFDEPYKQYRISDIYAERSQRGASDMELLSVTMNDGVVPRSEIEGKDNSSEDKSNYKVVLKGDMVYNSMRMWQGANGISPCDGIVSPAYTVLMPKNQISNGYFAALFKSPNLINQFRKNSQGMTSDTWNLKYPQIAPIKVCLPTLTEQEKIADMLGTLDKRIARQTQLVDSLKKYKRGLLRTIFLEKSALALLETADNLKIEEVCDVLSGKRIPKGETFSSQPTEYRYITVSDMGEKYVCSDTLQYITPHTEKQISRYKVKDGDIIISVAGTLGKLNIITSDLEGVNLTENCDRFTNFRRINPEYLYYVLSSDLIQAQIEASKTKNGQPKLALERIRNFTIPVPEQSNQEKLVRVMNTIDRQIAFYQAIYEKSCAMRAALLQQLFI